MVKETLIYSGFRHQVKGRWGGGQLQSMEAFDAIQANDTLMSEDISESQSGDNHSGFVETRVIVF